MSGGNGEIDWGSYLGQTARILLGEPNAGLSKKGVELRFGQHGSLSVALAGEKRGFWYDHERKEGGGVLDLLQREVGLMNGEAVQWLRDNCGAHIPERAHHSAPPPRRAGGVTRAASSRPAPRAAAGEARKPPKADVPLGKPVGTWIYQGPSGAPVMRVQRFHPGGRAEDKTYRQSQPDGQDGWKGGVAGVTMVPYRLPELIAAREGLVWIAEGEKCVDALVAAGLAPATCQPMGAGKWWEELNGWFEGRDVVVLTDNDQVGRDHGQMVAGQLHGTASRIRVLELPGLPPKGDVADWLAAGGDGEQLLALADSVPDWVRPLGIWDKIRAIAIHSPTLQRLADGDFSRVAGTRRHNLDQALGSALKRAGLSYDEMRDALVEWPHGSGAERAGEGQEEYFERIWDRAGKLVADHIPLPNEEPMPLRRDTRPPLEFPIEALPEALKEGAWAIQWRTQAPVAMCAQSVIAAASLAVQQHVDVVLPMGSRRPSSLFCISTAMSGERKSAVDELAVAPVRQWEAELAQKFREERGVYAREMEAFGAAKEAVMKNRALKGDRDQLDAALEAVGEAPTPPMLPIMLADNLTVEGIETYFANRGQPSLGMFTAEGGKIIGGHMMSDENRMKAGATLNLLWDGATLNRFRSGDGAHRMPGKRLSVHIMVQPGVIEQLMGDQTLSDLGTIARFLVVVPPTTAGTRMWREPTADVDKALGRYRDKLLRVLRMPPDHGEEENELTPRAVHLSAAARQIWIRFHDEVEVKLAPGAEYSPIRPFGSKLAEHAARLALVLAVFEDPDATAVSAEMMEAGAALGRHYAQEALRLVENGQVNRDIADAEVLLAWLQEKKVTRFILRRIYREGPTVFRDREAAQKAVAVLERHGWARRLPSGTEVDGKQAREAWDLWQGTRQ